MTILDRQYVQVDLESEDRLLMIDMTWRYRLWELKYVTSFLYSWDPFAIPYFRSHRVYAESKTVKVKGKSGCTTEQRRANQFENLTTEAYLSINIRFTRKSDDTATAQMHVFAKDSAYRWKWERNMSTSQMRIGPNSWTTEIRVYELLVESVLQLFKQSSRYILIFKIPVDG